MKKIQLIALFLVAGFYSRAQDSTYHFSLQQAVDYAYQNQVSVKNALIDERYTKQKVNEVKGMLTPQINGSFEINDYIELPTSFIPAAFFGGEPGTFAAIKFGQRYTSSAGISASQILFDGSYFLGVKASKVYVELSRKQTQQTKIETAIAVSKAYYNVLVNSARMELVNANETRLKKLRDDTKAMFDNGIVEKIDYNRTELAYNNITVQKQNTERFLALSYSLLKFQMGMDINSKLELTDVLNESKWADFIMPEQVDCNKRNEYSLLQTQMHFQELDLKRHRAEYMPSLAAFGSLSANASRNTFNIFNSDYRWYPMSVIGVRLSVPIWDGFQKNARVQQAKLEVMKTNNSLANLKQGVSLEYATAKMSWQNNLAELETSKKNRELASEISRVSKIKYDSGVGSSLELVDAESSLKEAETNYFNSLYNTIISKLEIDKALGNIK